MKRFIKKLLAFSFTILAILTVLQLLLSFKIKGKTLYGQDNLDQTANINADAVFLGSSRCWKHFDPIFFDSTFHIKSANLGVDGHPELTMAIVRLQNYLSKNKPPKFVVLNMDPINCSGSFDNSEFFTVKNAFARYAFMPEKNNQPFLNYFKFNFFERTVPLLAFFKYNIVIDCFVNHADAANYLKYGYDKQDEHWDTVAVPLQPQKFDFNSVQEKSVVWALDSLKKLCTQNNTKLICIQTPLYKVLDCSVSTPRIAKLCATEQIPFIDANIASINDNINNFYNHEHLNSTGVCKLNDFFAKDSVLISLLRKD
jgi:hypothetical protein